MKERWKGEEGGEGGEGGGERESAAAAAASRRPPPGAAGRKVVRAAGPAGEARASAPDAAPAGGRARLPPAACAGPKRGQEPLELPEPNRARGAAAVGPGASPRPPLPRLKSSPRPLPAPRPRGQSCERELFLVGGEFNYSTHAADWQRVCRFHSLGPGGEGLRRRALSSWHRGRPRVGVLGGGHPLALWRRRRWRRSLLQLASMAEHRLLAIPWLLCRAPFKAQA